MELLFVLIPIVYVAVIAYVVLLLQRIASAVERMANHFDNQV